MSILKFKQWLDEVDPYALQRITFYKALFIATIEVYVYWIFKPVSFTAFFTPFFFIIMYEAPVLSTFKEKEQLLIFSTAALISISVSFYLIYPFKILFLFFSLIGLAITYFFILKYFYTLKNLPMLLIALGTVIASAKPLANLQVAYGFISSTLTSTTFALISLRCFPNMYLIVWNKGLQKFIEYLEKDIDSAFNPHQKSPIGEEIQHLGMVRNYRRMLPKKYLMQSYRISTNLRNIQHALDNLYYETKNEVFWNGVKKNLFRLRKNMGTYTSCGAPSLPIEPQTKLQHHIVRCLQQAFIHWNKLCSLRQN